MLGVSPPRRARPQRTHRVVLGAITSTLSNKATRVTEFQLQWIASEGGPLLLLAAPLLAHWEGVAPPTAGRAVTATFRALGPGAPATDYDRACDVSDELGLVEVGPGYGLVLGDEPAATTWWPLPAGGVLVRWHQAESEAAVLAALRAALPDGLGSPTHRFSVTAAPLLLFDAALPGSEAQPGAHLWLSVPVGEYTVTTADYQPDRATILTLHRFAPRRQPGPAVSPEVADLHQHWRTDPPPPLPAAGE